MPLKAAIVPVTPFSRTAPCCGTRGTRTVRWSTRAAMSTASRRASPRPECPSEKIILTHGHIDHAGGAAELKEALGDVPIEGPHRADDFLLEGLAQQGLEFGMQGVRNVVPDRWLDEGDTVTVAGHTFSVLHCPGHSRGSVVFVNAAQRFILMGDVLFRARSAAPISLW